MSKYFKLLGKKIGRWIVEEHSHTDENKIIFFKCKCECGKTSIVRAYNLMSGKSTSCIECGILKSTIGNIGKSKATRDPVNHTISRLYTKYKVGAKKRGFSFKVNLELFKKMIFQNCFYCGISPERRVNFTRDAYPVKQERYDAGWIQYNGLDRLDPNKGYAKKNLVTCCTFCNVAKSNMNVEDFMEKIQRLSEHQLKNKKGVNNDT